MEQRLVQSPQMIQAMQILQLSALELEARIERELLENPLLELSEPVPQASDGDWQPPQEGRPDAGLRGERLAPSTQLGRRGTAEDSDRHQEALQNTAGRYQSLGQALEAQIALLEFDARQREIANYLAYSFDHHGLLPEALEELAAQCPVEGVTPDLMGEVLAELRRVVHPALGARNLQDCLRLQLEAAGIHDPLPAQIVNYHLEDLTHNRLPRVAKATGRSLEDVKDAIEFLRSLDPLPAREYGEDPAAPITPEVIVEEIDGAYEVRLARGTTQTVRLAPGHQELLRQAAAEGAQAWLKKRLDSARWFVDAVEQRRQTLQRIATAVFGRQQEFLDKGTRGLKPLRMQEVADEAGVHISTVSRAVAGKYAQTPRGIFPLKYFFTSGTTSSSGEAESQTSIKQRVAELIAGEDPTQPLSDDQVAAKLEASSGIKIARRTVTKYRKALGLVSSTERKSF